MRSENGMMNLLERAPGKPPVLPKAVGSASCRRFLSNSIVSDKIPKSKLLSVEKNRIFRHIEKCEAFVLNSRGLRGAKAPDKRSLPYRDVA